MAVKPIPHQVDKSQVRLGVTTSKVNAPYQIDLEKNISADVRVESVSAVVESEE